MPFGQPALIGWIDRQASNRRATGRAGGAAAVILSEQPVSEAAQEIDGSGCPRSVLPRAALVIHRAAGCLEFGHRTVQ